MPSSGKGRLGQAVFLPFSFAVEYLFQKESFRRRHRDIVRGDRWMFQQFFQIVGSVLPLCRFIEESRQPPHHFVKEAVAGNVKTDQIPEFQQFRPVNCADRIPFRMAARETAEIMPSRQQFSRFADFLRDWRVQPPTATCTLGERRSLKSISPSVY